MSIGARKVTCMSKEGQLYDKGNGKERGAYTPPEDSSVARSPNYFKRREKSNF